MAAPLVLTGFDLTIEDVVAVARDGRRVELDAAAVERMHAARAAVAHLQATGETAYGVTTGVGVRKRVTIETAGHDRLLIRQHLIGQGPTAPADVTRATALRLANALARGTTSARPELAEGVVGALNADRLPPVRTLGSVGQADLAQLADLAEGIVGETGIEPGEAIALLNQNAFSTGWAALAVADAVTLLDTLDVAAALDLTALGANLTILDEAVTATRGSIGLHETLVRLRALLDGTVSEPRNLQDPLVFRTVPHLHGSTRDAMAFVAAEVQRELNTHQSNPLVTEGGRVISTGCFDVTALATALDLARIVVGQVTAAAAERAVKLLQTPLTGLPEGLGARSGLAESALSRARDRGAGVRGRGAAARAAGLAGAGVDDAGRGHRGPDDDGAARCESARRAGRARERVVAVELQIALQAIELRDTTRLGPSLEEVREIVRREVPFVGEGEPLPDLEPLVLAVRLGLPGD